MLFQHSLKTPSGEACLHILSEKGNSPTVPSQHMGAENILADIDLRVASDFFQGGTTDDVPSSKALDCSKVIGHGPEEVIDDGMCLASLAQNIVRRDIIETLFVSKMSLGYR
jgi:hypothetical protein